MNSCISNFTEPATNIYKCNCTKGCVLVGNSACNENVTLCCKCECKKQEKKSTQHRKCGNYSQCSLKNL